MKRLTLFILFILFGIHLFSQLPGNDQKGTQLWKWEVYGGLTVASNGWGVNVQYAKVKSLKYRHLFGLTYNNIKNYKEYKSSSFFLINSSGFYFGKINSVLAIRPYYGGKRIVFKNTRDKGVEISWIWGVGLNLSLIKPVYLKIRKLGSLGTIIVEEPYNPDNHPLESIAGQSNFFRGFGSMSVLPGVYAKTGVFFDISARQPRIFGVEVGVQIDTYFKRVPIMNIKNNDFIYPAVYLNLLFGKKFTGYESKNGSKNRKKNKKTKMVKSKITNGR